jgi:hypothetical protein
MMDKPSDTIIKNYSTPIIVHDADGRQFSVRQMGALDRLRLFKALGYELAQNPPYLGMAMLAASVVAIDGIPVPSPVTEPQLESLVQRLGDVGIAAVACALSAQNAPVLETTNQGN